MDKETGDTWHMKLVLLRHVQEKVSKDENDKTVHHHQFVHYRNSLRSNLVEGLKLVLTAYHKMQIIVVQTSKHSRQKHLMHTTIFYLSFWHSYRQFLQKKKDYIIHLNGTLSSILALITMLRHLLIKIAIHPPIVTRNPGTTGQIGEEGSVLQGANLGHIRGPSKSKSITRGPH